MAADLVARIAGLWRYPVKSCAGEAVDRLTLGPDGWPEGDRSWGVVDAGGELTWMGAHPRLALVQARLRPGGIELKAPQHQLSLDEPQCDPITLRAWNGDRQDFDALQACDAGDEAAQLLQQATGAALRLVHLSLPAQRRPGPNPLHLVGDGSLQAWQQALEPPLDGLAQRVRPNVLLTAEDGGPLQPFIEDLVSVARIGTVRLERTAPCVRCQMTTIDPTTGEPQSAALDALTRLSAERAPGAPVQFGIYLRGQGAGVMRVGDRVELNLNF